MKCTVDHRDNLSILTMEETRIDSLLAPTLKTELVALHDTAKNLVFDLSNVSFIDSSGLSAILTGDRLWKESGLYIIVGVDQPMVKKLFEITRLDSILTIIPTLSEALDYVSMEILEQELRSDQDMDM